MQVIRNVSAGRPDESTGMVFTRMTLLQSAQAMARTGAVVDCMVLYSRRLDCDRNAHRPQSRSDYVDVD